MIYYILVAFLLAFAFTEIIRRVALKLQIVDKPDFARKIHKLPTPLLGGVAIFLAFFLVLFAAPEKILSGNLTVSHWLGVFVGALLLMIGGFLDDRYNLKPSRQIIWPLLAIAAVIIGGVSIAKITNPMGGYWYLSAGVSALLIGIWLLGMIYTTKLLDGVDGLVSGMTVIGGLIIFLFTSTTKYYQPDIAFAALMLSVCNFAFLLFNFYPAKIFLGEGGSLFSGYILGVLSIISGGKIAVALLIMGLPILDLAWTIIRRLLKGKNPLRFSDRAHLHHRLLDLGLSSRQTVLVFYGAALIFGLSGLFLQSQGKITALIILLFLMVLMVVIFDFMPKRSKLLLHICCAPCGGYLATQVLKKKYDLTLYFYNPNIDTRAEFEKRLTAVRDLATRFSLPLIVGPYDHNSWLQKIKDREAEPEGGRRCSACFISRLQATANLAKASGFDFFTTSLSASPYKDSATILNFGEMLGRQLGIKFLNLDFKNDDGSKRAAKFAKEQGYYRQKYCGCEFGQKATK